MKKYMQYIFLKSNFLQYSQIVFNIALTHYELDQKF